MICCGHPTSAEVVAAGWAAPGTAPSRIVAPRAAIRVTTARDRIMRTGRRLLAVSIDRACRQDVATASESMSSLGLAVLAAPLRTRRWAGRGGGGGGVFNGVGVPPMMISAKVAIASSSWAV